jgi:hypothetical protein
MICKEPGFGMIWLLSHPLFLSHQQQVVSLSLSSCWLPVKLTEGGCGKEGGGMGSGRSQIIQRRESLVLYKPFNTLWPKPSFSSNLWKLGNPDLRWKSLRIKIHRLEYDFL